MECLEPPLQEVPVDEWFCPECAISEAAAPTSGRHPLPPSEHGPEQAGQGTPGWEQGTWPLSRASPTGKACSCAAAQGLLCPQMPNP